MLTGGHEQSRVKAGLEHWTNRCVLGKHEQKLQRYIVLL